MPTATTRGSKIVTVKTTHPTFFEKYELINQELCTENEQLRKQLEDYYTATKISESYYNACKSILENIYPASKMGKFLATIQHDGDLENNYYLNGMGTPTNSNSAYNSMNKAYEQYRTLFYDIFLKFRLNNLNALDEETQSLYLPRPNMYIPDDYK